MSFSMASSVFLSLVIILGAGYTVWLVNRVLFGITSILVLRTTDLSFRESILLITLIVPVIILGFFPMGVVRYLSISLLGLVLFIMRNLIDFRVLDSVVLILGNV
jgi:NADH:ubiquinone oxidoreductase subunit 4 (subunit M)